MDNFPDLNSYLRFDVQGLSGNITSGAFTNNGFIVVADTELNDRFNYKSSDASTSSQRPKLVIEYTTSSATPTPGPSPTPTRTPTPVGTSTPTVPPTVTPTTQPTFQNATFIYDGDGKRVKSVINSAITTYFVGAHYEVSGSTVTKYYYAGSQRIAMRSNGTLNYLLGDHLGSTSLTTDAGGNKVSEERYKAWGEVRYATQGVPTRYQYTGQYSYEAEFGLYFYNARWYDPVLGRFAQADSIIPGGVQGYDRYAYVNNSPVMFTDPSGHRCEPVEECYPYRGYQVRLTEKGKKIQDLYSYYAAHPNGAWNSNGGAFTLADFVAWVLMIESKGDNTLLGYNMQVFSRQLWGTRIDAQGNATPTPYCPSRPCINGIFNFVGVYSESAMGRHSALVAGNFDAVEQLPTNYQNYLNSGHTIESIGNDVVANPKWTDYNNNVPVHSGNYKKGVFGPTWVTNMCMDTQMFTNARDGIVYKFKGENDWFVVVFTINQATYWSSHKSGMCG